MTGVVKLKVKDFTKYPGGRYREFGPHSGQEYREDVLLPALATGKNVEIDLSGVYTYAPSFLSEISDVMIYKEMISYEDYKRRISFIADNANAFFIKQVWGYIEETQQ